MFKIRILSFALAIFGISVSCSKQASDTDASSQLSFSLPKNFGNTSFSGSACFAVNIKAKDIQPTIPGSCDDQYGIFSGLVALGETIKMSAPRGTGRIIEIFYVISNELCEPNFDPARGLGQTFGANKVFRIGSTQANFDQPVVTVNLPIQYPSSANTLKSIFSTPATCDQISPITITSIKQASPVVGEFRGTTNLGSKVHVRVVNKQIELTSPASWSGRIIPARLGEKQ